MRDEIEAITRNLGVEEEEASKILEKGVAGGEITKQFNAKSWIEQRLLPSIVMIDEAGYSRMCVDALKILGKTAATDYGGSRQRDLGQLWADMTRGYLGELALALYLKKKWDIDTQLGHEVGALQDYLPTDIHMIKEQRGEYRSPKIKVGIKTTKWNGIWLDIPGDQFNHSDIHILVKVGIGRDHLFAFFKAISVFKDKVLKRGQDVGSLTSQESDELYEKLPTFKPIPAYICGFVSKDAHYSMLNYSGTKGRKNYTIDSWNGPIRAGDIATIKERESVSGKVTFKGIGTFAHDNGYLFNTGNLLWQRDDWEKVRRRL
ncbi:MAG TPA: hypothetical protein PJ991_01475 [Kiritimatiellia bacterium]|nr:hypothetical protein [Kiritimatiellia bacterium]